MLNDLGIAFLFLLSAFVDVTLIHALGDPIALLPLHFIVGVIVLHRGGPISGALWFGFSALLLPVIGFDNGTLLGYVATGALGFILTKRVFTNRSVYALVGLGAALYTSFAIVNGIFLLIAQKLSVSWHAYAGTELLSLAFVVAGLYLGFVLVKRSQRLSKSLFLVRNG